MLCNDRQSSETFIFVKFCNILVPFGNFCNHLQNPSLLPFHTISRQPIRVPVRANDFLQHLLWKPQGSIAQELVHSFLIIFSISECISRSNQMGLGKTSPCFAKDTHCLLRNSMRVLVIITTYFISTDFGHSNQ